MLGILRNKKSVFIITNGCDRRSLDAARLEDFFKANNCAIARTAQAADYIIFVTCSFRRGKEKQSLKKISEFSRYKGKLIVAGCLADIAPNRLRQVFNGEIIETRNLEKIDEIFNEFKVKFRSIPDAHSFYMTKWRRFIEYFEFNKPFLMKNLLYMFRMTYVSRMLNKMPRVRINIKKCKETGITKSAYLRVSCGCIERCAYCPIFRAVGELKSKKMDELLREYSGLLKQGYRDFTLVADNLGAYGLDCGSTFEELLESLSQADKNFSANWSLDQLHPRWVIKYKDVLLKYIAEGKITSINCPIQSGSNRILGLMQRHHGIEEITEIFKEFRKLQPGLFLSTHIIFGFPSESEEDFLATINAIKTIRFNDVELFAYYDGYDTIASKMSDKIPVETTTVRLERAINFLQRERILWTCDDI